MDILELREYCLSLPLAEETTPFDEDTLVYKVGGKMFAMFGISDFRHVSVKCDPAEGLELRERHPEVEGAYHMNKMHWIMMDMRGALGDEFIRDRILVSYRMVVARLPKKTRQEIEQAWKEE